MGVSTYYIKAMTNGTAIMREYEKIKITVCGLETLTASSADAYNISFDKVSIYEGASIPWSTLNSFFSFYAGY